MMRSALPHAVVATLAAIAATGCGGGARKAEVPVTMDSAADAIQRVGTVWVAGARDRGLKSPPSRIAIFDITTKSRVTLDGEASTIKEEITVSEQLQTRNGARFSCIAKGTVQTRVRYGRKNGEPAIEMMRPGTTLARRCDVPGLDPTVTVPPRNARFKLDGDRLKAFAPPLESREYIPME